MTQSNRLNGAEAFVRMLQKFGVRHVFGLCGDTSLPLYDALFRLDHGITHILARDERSAAYMADGYARIGGRVGVCEGPSGGGATYILPGLAEANESSVPVLAVNTDISVSSRGRFALTELDQKALFAPVTKWNRVLDDAAAIPETLREAFRQMTTGRPGAVHIALPFDVQTGEVDEADVTADEVYGRCPAARVAPQADAVGAAAAAVLGAADPVIVCAGGVAISGAQAELTALAEALGAPVATSISGRGAIADDHPLSLGVVGSNGGVPETRAVVDAADLVIFIGCRAGSVTTERWRHPDPARVRAVHIDVDPSVPGRNYETEAVLLGDAKLCLAALNAEIAGRGAKMPARTLDAAAVAAARKAKFDAFATLAASDAAPILPERLVADLDAMLPQDATVIADPGTPCPYLAAYLTLHARRFISNRAHGALGYALPAAIGAHFARPDVITMAVLGDGAFGFCSGELETIARLQVPVKLVVISNAGFGWIKAGQKSGYGARYFAVDFDRTDHAAVAAAYGVKSWRVAAAADLRPALAAAIAHDGPALVDVITQPLQDANAPVSEWVA
jgi:acetolactate synthase-1/2/3 large subunit